MSQKKSQNLSIKDVLSRVNITSEDERDFEQMAQEFVVGLNNSSMESSEKSERYDKIYAIEKTKWPYGMGSKLRSEIPEELHKKLDECITLSQKIAREACQTKELTEEYLRSHKNG